MSDQIQKVTVLRAPRDRVWKAVSDAAQFGSWFGMKFDQPFTAGAKLTGTMVPTTADPEVAKRQEAYRGTKLEMSVDAIEPPSRISFRWHPFAIEPGVDYSAEPTTLIVFQLEEVPGGTKLTITESGFDKIPLARRAKAFEMNSGGWEAQVKLVEKYLAAQA